MRRHMPTQGSANPGLTIQALAARTADYLVSKGSNVLAGRRDTTTHPQVRKTLSPPSTWGKGIPRIT